MIRKIAAFWYIAGLSAISFTHFRVGVPVFNISDLCFLISGMVMLLYFVFVDSRDIRYFISKNMFIVPLVFFLVGSVLSLIQTEYYYESFTVVMKILFIFLFFLPLGASIFRDFENIKLLKWGLLIGYTIPLILLFADKFVMHGINHKLMSMFNCGDSYYDSEWNNRNGAYMGHPNNLAALLVCAIPYYYYRAVNSRRFMKLAYILLMCAGVYGLLASGSRAALVALFLSMSVLFILLKGRGFFLVTSIKYFFVASMAISVLVLVSYHMPDSPVARLMEMQDQKIGRYLPDQDRVSSAYTALEYFSDNMLTGIGVNYASSLNETVFVHNTLLRFAASIGIFGAVSLLLFYLIPLFTSLKIIRNDDFKEDMLLKYAVAASVGWIIFDMFQPQFHQRFKWITVVIVIISHNYVKRQRSCYEQK